MTTRQDRLEAYKKAIRVKYEEEKNGEFSSFLFNPSRAKLRDLCNEIFKENNNPDDLKSFKLFLGFDYNLNHLNRLREQKDKFRPIETFFKGETDLQDIEGINIAAILVNFEPRPFAKFRQTDLPAKEIENTNENEFSTSNTLKNKPDSRKETPRSSFLPGVGKSKGMALSLLFVTLLGGFSLSKWVFNQKDCLEWKVDRYVPTECVNEKKALRIQTLIQKNEKLTDFRKIPVDESTVFFAPDGKPLVWYCKINTYRIDYFNSNGVGFHPETGKVLRPITPYIIDKYVKGKK
ncbi:hypothetical protein [Flavobacterium sp.]|uniref:hypothetical protein n=1 Tax=Flavobacterium sp. TaxID=239 RepID=UPI002FD9B66D